MNTINLIDKDSDIVDLVKCNCPLILSNPGCSNGAASRRAESPNPSKTPAEGDQGQGQGSSI